MSDAVARALGAAAVWARRATLAAATCAAAVALATDAALPEIAASRATLFAEGTICLLLVLGAAGALLAPGESRLHRAARAMVRGGIALTLGGSAASFALREVHTFQVGEGQEWSPDAASGLPRLAISRVRLTAKGSNLLLSKTVDVEALPLDDARASPVHVGLFPPTFLGAWRVSVLRYGYAPGLRWEEDGRTNLDAYVMLGTLPHSPEEARLVAWSPEPNLMMGVGYYPPRLEELVPAAASGAHVFMRIERARLAGVERDLTGADAWRWLADGPLEAPTLAVQVLHGRERVCEVRLGAGDEVPCSRGVVRVAHDVPLWVEVLAVRDPWLPVGVAGAALTVVGAAVTGVAALRRRRARG